MKTAKAGIVYLVVVSLFLLLPFFEPGISAQTNKKPATPPSLSTRTTPRHEVHRLSFGGTVTIVGAPAGSITIEGWQRNEVDVTAEVELHGPSEDDLNRLAAVNTFIVDEDANHIRILTTGTHDRKFLKRVAKDFPKSLIGLPWKIDYRVKVPALTDLEVDGGSGAIKLSGVEGAIRINAMQSDADLSLTGSLVSATIQRGTVNVTIPVRSWHGLGAEIRLATGRMTIDLMPGFSGDINAEVLRMGEVKNSFPDVQAGGSNAITPRSIRARLGSGGATLSFTVGDGTIEIRQSKQ